MANDIIKRILDASRIGQSRRTTEAEELALEKARREERENAPQFSLSSLMSPEELETSTRGLSIADLMREDVTGMEEQKVRVPGVSSEEAQRIGRIQTPTMTPSQFKEAAYASLLLRRPALEERKVAVQEQKEENRQEQIKQKIKTEGNAGSPPVPAPKLEPKITEGQGITATYAKRMDDSDPIITNLEAYVTNANPILFSGQKNLPDVLNKLKTKEFQSFEQARRNFLNAVLRRESGAVISPTEFVEGNRQYFPLPGDSQEVLEQKRKNRETVKQGFVSGSGGAYSKIIKDTAFKEAQDAILKGASKDKVIQRLLSEFPKSANEIIGSFR